MACRGESVVVALVEIVMVCRGESVVVALVGQSAVGLDGVRQYPCVCGGGCVWEGGRDRCDPTHSCPPWEPL